MKNITRIALILFVAFLFFYFGMPVLNYGFLQLPVMLLLLVILIMFLRTRFSVAPEFKKVTLVSVPPRFFYIIAIALVLYMTVLPLVTSATMLHAEAYRSMIGEVKNGTDLSHHIAPISIDEIRVVDEPLAHLLGEKILGSQTALGSQVELGDFTIQKVNNELFWVAPLLHTGFFKWYKNSEGTPGYVMVSATNERDVRLIMQNAGAPLKIKFQPEAFFGSQIERHVYFNGYESTGLADYQFEIDDSGKPFWIVTTYQKEIGFSGDNATGVLVVDAQTGAIQQYSTKNMPLWVDRAQPIRFVIEQLDDWGDLVHGYWNWSKEDKLTTTEDLTLVYGQDHRSYWYTGVSSVGKEESNVGFVLVDTRTKETHFYKQSGATELAARSSAEGKVQEKGYSSSLPIPYIINNIPTYVMTLKDDGGLVKMYAMVAISDYTIVGVGNTMRETLSSFKNVYNMADNRVNSTSAANRKTLESIVTRIHSDVKNGNSFYYFTVKDYPNIFVGASQMSNELPVTMPGDSVTISFDLDPEEVIDITAFDNKAVGKK
ncbi:hypothetical protein [Flavobacterium sp. 3HN19-14]|uniref:hypothetical protein n=1 Tax=Flavobacterium sp. 3HN19-14 TaxID=3448133 RepID=UPI003EDFCBD2